MATNKLAGGHWLAVLESAAPALVQQLEGGQPGAAATAQSRPESPARDGPIAVVPIIGTILSRCGPFSEMFGYISPQRIAGEIRAAVQVKDLEHLVLEIDSPGGTVDGTHELAEAVRQATQALGPDRVTAHISGIGASAAYWVASQAGQIIAEPTAQVGSIGVIWVHASLERAFTEEGLDVTILRRPEDKALQTPFEALAPEGRVEMERVLGQLHAQFTQAVRAGRPGADIAAAGGAVWLAEDAIRLGLIDRVGSILDVVARATEDTEGSMLGRKKRAEAEAGPTGEIDGEQQELKVDPGVIEGLTEQLETLSGQVSALEGRIESLAELVTAGSELVTATADRQSALEEALASREEGLTERHAAQVSRVDTLVARMGTLEEGLADLKNHPGVDRGDRTGSSVADSGEFAAIRRDYLGG